jgi:hypothetical protein
MVSMVLDPGLAVEEELPALLPVVLVESDDEHPRRTSARPSRIAD